jgi:signal transduction histidine kinase
MQDAHRQKLAVALMALGFGLLLAFVCLFLKNAWDDEMGKLKQGINLLLVNTVRGIERDVLDRVVLRGIQAAGGDSVRIALRLPGPAQRDSARHVTFVHEEQRSVHLFQGREAPAEGLRRDTLTDIRVMPQQNGTVGSLSMIVAIGADTQPPLVDTLLRSLRPKSDFFPTLAQQFEAALAAEGPAVQARLQPLGADSAALPGLVAATYTDLFSEAAYAVVVEGHRGYLLRQMLPQILFSALLILCVGLAFLFIYQSLRQQHRLTELKNDFIRNITHELQTPIATASVAVEAMQHFDALQEPERARAYLDIAGMELKRLSLLVDKVLRMSLFEKQAPALRLEPLDMKSIIEEILHTMHLQFEKCGATVRFLPEGSGFSLLGDRLHLVSVVYNLLDNALKYSQGPPDISIGLRREGAQLALWVRDRGIGIAPDFQGRVFERFFRVPTGDVHNVKGHGLGLSYVASVVRQHGGSIGVESQAGEGACFRVLLPTKPTQHAHEEH